MEKSIKNNLKSIRIIYSALIIATTSFLVFSIVLKYIGTGQSMIEDMMIYQIFQLVAFIIGISSVGGGIYIFARKIKAITSDEIAEKVIKYKEAMVIRVAAIEGACFFFIASYFIFQQDFFIIATIIGLGFLAYFFPTTARIAKELNIQEKELQ